MNAHIERRERMMDKSRYFECESCGAVAQGWRVAHWYGPWHEDNCQNPSRVVEIERDASDSDEAGA